MINIEDSHKEIAFGDAVAGEWFIWLGLVYMKTLEEYYGCNAVCLNDGTFEVFDPTDKIIPIPIAKLV